MAFIPQPKAKKGFSVDANVAESFGDWARQTRTPIGAGVTLGMWIVMHLNANERESLLAAMDADEDIPPGGLVVTRRTDESGEAEAVVRRQTPPPRGRER